MKWFQGPIPDAIKTSKATNSVFIVYVSGEDDLSKKMDITWEDAQVVELCEQEKFVAVKIKANSEECGFFSQIYPVVVVPSTFFIGTNGVPLEVIGGYVPGADFVKKMQDVIKANKSPSTPASQQTISAAPPSEPVKTHQTSTEVPGAESPSTPPESGAAAGASVTSETPTDTQTADEDSPEAKKAKIDLETRVQIAKDLVEQKRIEKMQKEEEAARQKEKERIQSGRDLQKLKQFQQEREMMETHNQIKKDREEDRKARERVKEQIARDRAERAARFNKEKADREKAQEEAKRVKLMAQQQAAAEAEARRSESARLQFRLPDGSSVNHTFPSGETLQQAYNFASQHLGRSVTISTTFPRRTFTEADMSKSFIDLQLAPSAVVMVVPGQRSARSSDDGGGSSGEVQSTGILGLILSPFMLVFNLLRTLFLSLTSSSPSSPPSSSQDTKTSASGGERNMRAYQRRSAGGVTGVSRTEGNVHRFKNTDDDDDENATWNGNSTQQM